MVAIVDNQILLHGKMLHAQMLHGQMLHRHILNWQMLHGQSSHKVVLNQSFLIWLISSFNWNFSCGWVGGWVLDQMEIKPTQPQLKLKWSWGWAWQYVAWANCFLCLQPQHPNLAPTCQQVKSSQTPACGCNVYYWFCKILVVVLVFFGSYNWTTYKRPYLNCYWSELRQTLKVGW